MKHRIVSLFFCFVFSCWTVAATAAGRDYKCVVERVSSASGDNGSSHQFYVDNYVGRDFSVDRASGVMAGALKNSYVTEPQVIDFGSSENAYKAVATMRVDQGAGAGSSVYALTIEEFESGPEKPFVFLMNATVFFGKCEHY
ncbi:hypothetical protein ACQKC1_08075 [Shewanella baltica]|uniref:hypothetical protein n=1 Tax=Shewanella baltica TaxID=62322 RepID=UPI003D00DEE2